MSATGAAIASGIITDGVPLARLTTLRVGGPARRLLTATTTDAVIDAVSGCDTRGEPVLVLGGGSNLLIADGGFDGTVVRVATRGIEVDSDERCGGATSGSPPASRGTTWWRSLSTGLGGRRGPLGDPGLDRRDAGAERRRLRRRRWPRPSPGTRLGPPRPARCAPSRRPTAGSATARRVQARRPAARFVVLEVDLPASRVGDLGAPVRYAELAGALGVEPGPGAAAPRPRGRPGAAPRQGHGARRRRRPTTRGACGSFFTNPVLAARTEPPALRAGAPAGPLPGRRRRQDQRRLADRARRVRQGHRPARAAGPALHEARPGADQPRYRVRRRRDRPGPRGARRRARGVRDCLEPEPVLVGCSLQPV